MAGGNPVQSAAMALKTAVIGNRGRRMFNLHLAIM